MSDASFYNYDKTNKEDFIKHYLKENIEQNIKLIPSKFSIVCLTHNFVSYLKIILDNQDFTLEQVLRDYFFVYVTFNPKDQEYILLCKYKNYCKKIDKTYLEIRKKIFDKHRLPVTLSEISGMFHLDKASKIDYSDELDKIQGLSEEDEVNLDNIQSNFESIVNSGDGDLNENESDSFMVVVRLGDSDEITETEYIPKFLFYIKKDLVCSDYQDTLTYHQVWIQGEMKDKLGILEEDDKNIFYQIGTHIYKYVSGKTSYLNSVLLSPCYISSESTFTEKGVLLKALKIDIDDKNRQNIDNKFTVKIEGISLDPWDYKQTSIYTGITINGMSVSKNQISNFQYSFGDKFFELQTKLETDDSPSESEILNIKDDIGFSNILMGQVKFESKYNTNDTNDTNEDLLKNTEIFLKPFPILKSEKSDITLTLSIPEIHYLVISFYLDIFQNIYQKKLTITNNYSDKFLFGKIEPTALDLKKNLISSFLWDKNLDKSIKQNIQSLKYNNLENLKEEYDNLNISEEQKKYLKVCGGFIDENDSVDSSEDTPLDIYNTKDIGKKNCSLVAISSNQVVRIISRDKIKDLLGKSESNNQKQESVNSKSSKGSKTTKSSTGKKGSSTTEDTGVEVKGSQASISGSSGSKVEGALAKAEAKTKNVGKTTDVTQNAVVNQAPVLSIEKMLKEVKPIDIYKHLNKVHEYVEIFKSKIENDVEIQKSQAAEDATVEEALVRNNEQQTGGSNLIWYLTGSGDDKEGKKLKIEIDNMYLLLGDQGAKIKMVLPNYEEVENEVGETVILKEAFQKKSKKLYRGEKSVILPIFNDINFLESEIYFGTRESEVEKILTKIKLEGENYEPEDPDKEEEDEEDEDEEAEPEDEKEGEEEDEEDDEEEDEEGSNKEDKKQDLVLFQSNYTRYLATQKEAFSERYKNLEEGLEEMTEEKEIKKKIKQINSYMEAIFKQHKSNISKINYNNRRFLSKSSKKKEFEGKKKGELEKEATEVFDKFKNQLRELRKKYMAKIVVKFENGKFSKINNSYFKLKKETSARNSDAPKNEKMSRVSRFYYKSLYQTAEKDLKDVLVENTIDPSMARIMYIMVLLGTNTLKYYLNEIELMKPHFPELQGIETDDLVSKLDSKEFQVTSNEEKQNFGSSHRKCKDSMSIALGCIFSVIADSSSKHSAETCRCCSMDELKQESEAEKAKKAAEEAKQAEIDGETPDGEEGEEGEEGAEGAEGTNAESAEGTEATNVESAEGTTATNAEGTEATNAESTEGAEGAEGAEGKGTKATGGGKSNEEIEKQLQEDYQKFQNNLSLKEQTSEKQDEMLAEMIITKKTYEQHREVVLEKELELEEPGKMKKNYLIEFPEDVLFFQQRKRLMTEFNKYLMSAITIPMRVHNLFESKKKLEGEIQKQIDELDKKYNIVNLEQDKSNQELITYLKVYQKQNKEQERLKRILADPNTADTFKNSTLDEYVSHEKMRLKMKMEMIQKEPKIKKYFQDANDLEKARNNMDMIIKVTGILKEETQEFENNLDTKKRKFYAINTLYLEEFVYIKNEFEMAELQGEKIQLEEKKNYLKNLNDIYSFYYVLKLQLERNYQKIEKLKKDANEEFSKVYSLESKLKRELSGTMMPAARKKKKEELESIQENLFFHKYNFYNIKKLIFFILDLLIKCNYFLQVVEYGKNVINGMFLNRTLQDIMTHSKGIISMPKKELLTGDKIEVKITGPNMIKILNRIEIFYRDLVNSKKRLHQEKNKVIVEYNELVNQSLEIVESMKSSKIVPDRNKQNIKDRENKKILESNSIKKIYLQTFIQDCTELNRHYLKIKKPEDVLLVARLVKIRYGNNKTKKKTRKDGKMLFQEQFLEKYSEKEQSEMKSVLEKINMRILTLNKFYTHNTLYNFISKMTRKKNLIK